MAPDIGRWLRTCFGQDAGPPSAKNTIKLRELVVWLLPGSAKLLAKHHTAGADAELHLRLCRALQARSSDRLEAAQTHGNQQHATASVRRKSTRARSETADTVSNAGLKARSISDVKIEGRNALR